MQADGGVAVCVQAIGALENLRHHDLAIDDEFGTVALDCQLGPQIFPCGKSGVKFGVREDAAVRFIYIRIAAARRLRDVREQGGGTGEVREDRVIAVAPYGKPETRSGLGDIYRVERMQGTPSLLLSIANRHIDAPLDVRRTSRIIDPLLSASDIAVEYLPAFRVPRRDPGMYQRGKRHVPLGPSPVGLPASTWLRINRDGTRFVGKQCARQDNGEDQPNREK